MPSGREVEYHHREMAALWIRSAPLVRLADTKLAIDAQLHLLVYTGESDECPRQIFVKF